MNELIHSFGEESRSLGKNAMQSSATKGRQNSSILEK